MTESEWLECADPQQLLPLLDERQKGFFARACVRRIWHLVQSDSSKNASNVAEEYLLGKVTRKALRLTADTARDAYFDSYDPADADSGNTADAAGVSAADAAAAYPADAHATVHVADGAARSVEDSDAERQAQSTLTREIANPYRPASINPSWLTSTVLALAKAAYEERIMPSGELDRERLAVLSDAVEAAGCDDADILSHLRSTGPHVRGCWAVDLLTGRS